MDKYGLAPLVLSHCVEFLKQRPVGTRFHPKKNQYYLDSKMITRIIRYDGDFRATVDSSETKFFGNMIRVMILMELLESPIRKEMFQVVENTDFNRVAIDVYLCKRMITKIPKGRRVELRSEKYEPVSQ